MHAYPDQSPDQPMCARHPLLVATLACERCGSFSCSVCERLTNDGKRVCDACLPLDRSYVLAERASRFIANMVDGFLFGLTLLPTIIGVVAFSESVRAGLVFFLLGLLPMGWFAYVQIRHARTGRSIGKRGQGIRVVRSDGSPVSLWRILILRNLILGVIGNLVNVVGLIDSLMIFGERRRCLHDYLADTIVIVDQGDDGP